MPRLIARLVKSLENNFSDPTIKRVPSTHNRRKKRSLSGPLPTSPSFSPFGRDHSILLDDVNPITNAANYTRHKQLPPNAEIQPSLKRAAVAAGEYDQPRVMDGQDRTWWASPYLRMLSSPIRQCMLTHRLLPSDFLIRLSPMRIPTPRLSREAQSLVPDGLEHPKYKSRRAYTGNYIICWKDAIEHLAERGYYKRLAPNVSMHSLLGDHIGHLLRVRVLQELELLSGRLRTKPQGAEDATLIRRLTRAEWKSIKATGIIPYESAVAVIVVPPLNRNPVTKAGIVADFNTKNEGPFITVPSHPQRPLPPLSTIHTIAENPMFDDVIPDCLPSSKVPLYNGLSLFPSGSQRASLYDRLTGLLSVERHARYREHGRPAEPTTPRDEESRDKWKRGDQKASHAFLLCSDEKTAMRADMAAVAIALWRIRMWEGAGWEEYGGASQKGWELRR